MLFGDANGEEPYVSSEVMGLDDIKRIVDQFARVARNAIRAGFDGVEIHGLRTSLRLSLKKRADKSVLQEAMAISSTHLSMIISMIVGTSMAIHLRIV